ncbi:hypothetical protein, partial [Bordetella pertussis]|uniref:hypothetical protein n=1 Tax=Bordetella pertussis TaxID=520 RepID=UPI001C9E5A69
MRNGAAPTSSSTASQASQGLYCSPCTKSGAARASASVYQRRGAGQRQQQGRRPQSGQRPRFGAR